MTTKYCDMQRQTQDAVRPSQEKSWKSRIIFKHLQLGHVLQSSMSHSKWRFTRSVTGAGPKPRDRCHARHSLDVPGTEMSMFRNCGCWTSRQRIIRVSCATNLGPICGMNRRRRRVMCLLLCIVLALGIKRWRLGSSGSDPRFPKAMPE